MLFCFDAVITKSFLNKDCTGYMHVITKLRLLLILQCLDEIKKALADPHVRPPRRLSLIKRARKLCESLSVNAKKQRKNESSAKRRKPSDAGKRISKDTLRFELSDFPEMEIIPAQEV